MLDLEIAIGCVSCHMVHHVTVNREDYKDWASGKHAQDAFPYLDAAQRELIISHVCGECFDEMFPEDEEDYFVVTKNS